MEYVTIGKILNTFGIKGELKVDVYTDFPEDRFKKGSTVYIGEDYLPFKVAAYREHKGFMLLLLEDNEDINQIEKYKGMYLYKSKDEIKPLQEGEYYFSDLKDLDVYVDDKKIGRVLRVEEGLRNNNLRVLKEEDGNEYLIPFIPVFIKKVDLVKKRIDINWIEGLI
ncbi:MAG: ribosome maturation factor RimM [Erysipelotrichaceae bacterium]|nr:ribosome maturation factor RimM [Erysipelotrichaceae bacterium]